MANIRSKIDYPDFRNSVLKVFYYGNEVSCNIPEFFKDVDTAFNIACRNLPSTVSEKYLFQEVLLYIRSGHDFISHWC